MLKGAIAQMLALAGGNINTSFPAGKSERKAKNPNSPESQYLLARAEEKRSRRAAHREIVSQHVEAIAVEATTHGLPPLGSVFTRFGSGPYRTADYYTGRDAIRVKVAEANELRRVGLENGTIQTKDSWGIPLKEFGRRLPRKPKKNAMRKLRVL